MDNSKMETNARTATQHSGFEPKKAHVAEAANELVNESKKLVSELYEEGLNRVSDAHKTVLEQSDVLLEKVKANPLASVLIAAGAGFLLHSLLRK